MKTLRLLAALLVAALLSPLAFPQESSEVTSLLAKARRGNGIAQYNVGLAYAEGRGVAADSIEAFVWLSLARENGARGRALDNLTGTFDRPTLELAQRRLTERRSELGVRTTSPASARTETAAAVPGSTAKETAPKAAASAAPASPVQPQIDDTIARLQAEREALAARLNEVTADVTALRAERNRLISLNSEHEKTARTATEANQALQEKARLAEARSTELGLAADITKGELTRVRMALTAAQKAAQPVSPAIPDLRGRVAELEAQLVAAKSTAPDTTALDQKTRELQAALAELETSRTFGRQVEDTLNKVNDDRARVAASAAAELEAARAFGQQVESTLNRVTDQKTALETALRATESARDGYAREYEATKAQLATVQTRQPAAPSYPDLSGRVAELEAALVARSAAPAYPDLRSRVAELETNVAALSSETASAKEQVIALAKAKEAAEKSLSAKPSAPAYPDLRSRVAEMETALASASADATRAKQEAATLAQAKTEAQQQMAALTQSRETAVSTLNRELETTKSALAQANDALRAKPAAPAYPDLSGRVAELESAFTAASTGLAQAQAQLAAKSSAPSAPAYPDLSGKVTELESQLAGLSTEAARAKQEAGVLAKARDEAAQKAATLELARNEVAKQFDDYKSATAAAQRERTTLLANIKLLESDKVSLRRQAETVGSESGQLRTQVAALKEQLAAKPAVPGAPAFPDLSGRVAELETKLAAASKAAPAYPDYTSLVKDLTTEVTKLRTLRDQQQQAVAALSAQAASTKQEAAASLKAKEDALAASTSRVMELEAQVGSLQTTVAAAPTALAYPDLSGKVAELETALAAKPAAPAYPDLSGRVIALESELAAARSSTPAYPDLSGKVAGLETALAAMSSEAATAKQEVAGLIKAKEDKPAAPAYPDLSGRVSELETQLARVSSELSAVASAKSEADQQIVALNKAREEAQTAPASSVSSGRVTELESALADSARKLVAADNAQIQLQQQLADAQAAGKTKDDAGAQLGRERDELTGRLTLLNGEVTQLRTDRERMQKMLADAGRQLRDSSADASRIKELETMSTGLQASLATANAQTGELQTALAAKAASPDFPDLRERVTGLERELATARASAPAYPDQRNRVTELESQLASATADLSAVGSAKADLSGRVVELEREVAAARSAAPAYPDLSGRVSELEARLAQAPAAVAPAYPDLTDRVRELEAQLAAAPKSRAPVYPNLSGRVVELEGALADTRRQLSESETALRAAAQAPTPAATAAVAPETTDTTDLQQRLAETEDKLATALRGYTLLQKDRDALQAKSGQANESLLTEKNSLAAQVTTLTAQVEQLQAASATQAEAVRASAGVTSEKDALAARLAEVETRAANAQAEATRLGESLAALQRSTGQISGDAISNRALAQQLQGANAVLAQENYQLKTMLSRTTGGPAAPRSAPTAPTALPAARTHIVASGDSLSKISQRYYGTAGRWQEIYNANAGKLGPNGILRVGTELRIP